MPVYEYDCLQCQSKFEVTRRVHETGGNCCPKCGAEGRRIYFPPHLVFKGPGFYVTESRTEKDPEVEHAKKEKESAEKALKESEAKPAGTEPEKAKPAAKSEPDKPISTAE